MKHAAFSRFLRRIDLIYSDKKKLLNIDMLLTSSEKISTISVPFTLESLNFSYTFNSISYILLSLKKEVIPKCKFRKVEGGPLSLWFYRVMDYCGTIKVLGNKELSHSPLISSLGLLKMDQSPNPCLWIGTSIHNILRHKHFAFFSTKHKWPTRMSQLKRALIPLLQMERLKIFRILATYFMPSRHV